MPTGTASITFGTGKKDTSVAVTGQASILTTSHVEAFLMGDATSDHNADEHLMASVCIDLVCSSPQAGTGFTVYAFVRGTTDVSGQFTIHWVWV